MTTITGSLVDVVGSTTSGRIEVWATDPRKDGNDTVGTGVGQILVVNGVIQPIDVSPGPCSFYISIGTWIQLIEGAVVPEEESVDFWDVIESTVDYAPAVVSQVRADRLAAEAARDQAQAAASSVQITDTAGFESGANVRKAAAALQRAASGTGKCDIAVVGDSMSTAYTGSGYDFTGAWYRRLKTSLLSDGYADGGTGFVPCVQGSETAVDPRWSLSGWNTTNYGFILSTATGATATFTSDVAGTSVELIYGNTGNPFTVSIDGGSPVTVTTTGGVVVKPYVVSGLPNTTHTVQIVGQQYAALIGISVKAASGVRFSPVGKYGMTAYAFADDYSLLRETAVAAVPSPDIVIIQVGANDLTASAKTPAETVEKIRQIRQLWPNADAILSIEPQTTTEVTSVVWADFQARLRALGTELGCAVIDVHRRWGGPASAVSLGFVGADGKHPNANGQRDIASIYKRSFRKIY